ncbi:hypothetical protein AGOR_G00118890 [Albula goreensis]|uniref:Muscular LMNA-interacting protein n=1 Tax=Albula goreensis TaxID=1534307 RepID=A0A8T3DBT2_9TELE|nr:hypothetical protein AGOR_G00118890 [Albula goreensis]
MQQEMDMKKNKTLTDSAKEGMPKIPPKISSTRILSFTFVPIVKRLPTENTVTLGEKRRQPRRTPNEHLGTLREAATNQTMSENGVFKAEFVYIGSDIDEKEPGDRGSGLAREEVVPRLETHSQPYKIKSSYKALAAIPTNTLLLEQQAIDEEVEKEGHPLDAAEGQGVTETHSEMCSPAQLRQQSEELYAAIDQVLQDPLPMRRSHSAPQSLVTLTDPEAPKRFTSLPRSAGRETKYATFNLQPSASTEKNLTKPGVIRPVIIIPKLTEEEDEEEDYPNPFRQQYLEEMSEELRHKFVRLDSPKPEHPIVTIHENEALSSNQLGSNPAGQSPKLAEDHRDPGSPELGKGHAQELILLITEDEQTGTSHETSRSSKIGAATFNAAQEKAGVHETHI